MKRVNQKSALLTVLLLSLLYADVYSLHFWEIPDPRAPFIAMARSHPGDGATVVYNPVYCEQIGEACIFFRTHEEAHIFLNDLLLESGQQPASVEDKADCWAVSFITPQQVQAAIRFFNEIDKYPDIPVIGDPAHRAEVIENCARKADKWIVDN